MSWWGGQATECPSNSPIIQRRFWRLDVFNSRPGRNNVSGTPSLRHMVHCDGMGMIFWYARSAAGGWNGAWQDFPLSGSSNDTQTADWESCNGVTAVDFVGEYPWGVGEYRTEQLSWDDRWRTGMVSIVEAESSASPLFKDPVNSTAGAYSANIILWTNPGGDNAWSCRDIQECNRWDDIWNQLQTHQLIAHGKCNSHPGESED